jgi:hypothetical protein
MTLPVESPPALSRRDALRDAVPVPRRLPAAAGGPSAELDRLLGENPESPVFP